MRISVVDHYASQHPFGGPDMAYRPGDVLEVSEDVGQFLLRDAPGCFEVLAPDAPEPEAQQDGEGEGDGLRLLGRAELLDLAVRESVEGVSTRSRRQELLAAIRAHRAEAAAPGVTPQVVARSGDAEVIGYRDDGQPIAGWLDDATGRWQTADPSPEAGEAASAANISVTGLTGIGTQPGPDGRAYLVLAGGDADGYTADARRPSEDVLRRWLLTIDGSLLVGDLDRAGLVRTIEELSEDG